MLARINLLFAFSMLTLLVFYFAGRFVLVKIVAAVTPSLVPYFIAGYTLVALMLTVLIVAKTTIRLEAMSSAARARRPNARYFVAQVLLCLAHLCVLYGIYAMFFPGSDGATQSPWLLAPLVYATGIYLAVIDMRKRASQATA
ncbi:MAG: hypothetical protein JSU95_05185 [Betaproteobacteria bacterium]|nr:MAG: hypothetical protein JSU95_05185 [Betaproteobacteria bacterium]